MSWHEETSGPEEEERWTGRLFSFITSLILVCSSFLLLISHPPCHHFTLHRLSVCWQTFRHDRKRQLCFLCFLPPFVSLKSSFHSCSACFPLKKIGTKTTASAAAASNPTQKQGRRYIHRCKHGCQCVFLTGRMGSSCCDPLEVLLFYFGRAPFLPFTALPSS